MNTWKKYCHLIVHSTPTQYVACPIKILWPKELSLAKTKIGEAKVAPSSRKFFKRIFSEKYSNSPGIIINWYFSKFTRKRHVFVLLVDKYGKNPTGSVLNDQWEIPNHYGVRWFKCKLIITWNLYSSCISGHGLLCHNLSWIYLKIWSIWCTVLFEHFS